ncbi:MAG: aldehyde dehydrogenase family protein [Candidatus Micrarchaeota archaeon]|nr:aldehyde dehydrogenase family protein [Candidatus Micrarchaeota archaeon]
MAKNKFNNESTYKSYLDGGSEDEFDRLFDDAVIGVKDEFGKNHPMYIGGKEVYSNERIEEKSPIDFKTVLGTFQKGTKEHAQLAISEAKKAFGQWSNSPYKQRMAIFENAANLLSERKFKVAAILSYENGKSRYESIGEVDEAIDFMRYYANEMAINKGYSRSNKIMQSRKGVDSGFQGAPSGAEKIKISMKPYGVFGVIAPFNFPISISIGMSVGALITGNTVVFKPSSTDNMTMLTGLKIYELFKDAGVPEGVFNYVTGPGSVVGDELVTNEDVSGIAFTGSRITGMSMVSKCFSMGKQKVFIVEMGGKNPAIVSKNADLDRSVAGVSSAAFGFAGQKCSALSRVYVHESVKEQFVSKLISKVMELKIGNPLEKGIYIGPIISESAFRRYTEMIGKAKTSGRILYGGNIVKTGFADGFYVEPTIIEVHHDNELVHKELFLPILTIESFSDLDDAIRLANDTEYGLTAGFYSKSGKEIKRFIDNINAGVIYINREISATTGAIVGVHTFVGWKGSALTGKGTGSKFYLQQFMREQSVSITK